MKVNIIEAYTDKRNVICIEEHKKDDKIFEINEEAVITGEIYCNYAWGRFTYQVQVLINNINYYYTAKQVERFFDDIKAIRKNKIEKLNNI